jgi:hypothetical protein
MPEDGETFVINGAGYSIENASDNEVPPPPGAGFVTLTERAPTLAVGEIWMLTVRVVLDPLTSATVIPSPNETVLEELINPVPVRKTLMF